MGKMTTALMLLVVASGCAGPRARLGYIPTATFGVKFADPGNLGTHAYHYSPFENGGILYTCGAGHLDIDHVRGNADQTRFRIEQLRKILSNRQEHFEFSLAGETSIHMVDLTYPNNWDQLPQKDRIIDEIAFSAGPWFVYSATIWHEILTWYGVHFMLIEPEFNSAFSWEDLYSNLLGIHLALEAMKDTEHDFDTAMTLALEKALDRLGIQPRATAIAASDSVSGTWYTGNLVPDVKMRNFDIGLDGTVTPTLLANVPGCGDPRPVPLEAPTLKILDKYGFSVMYEIKPNVLEQGAIYEAARANRIFPQKHYPVLLEAMKKQALQKGYQYQE